MKEAAIIDVEFESIIDAASVGVVAAEQVLREIRPTVVTTSFYSTSTLPSVRDNYVEMLKAAALSLAKKTVLNLILAELPRGLTTGIVGSIVTPVIGFVIGLVIQYAIMKTELAIFFLYIDLRTSAQGRDFEKSMKLNLDAQKSGNKEAIKNAEKKLVDSFRELAKFTS